MKDVRDLMRRTIGGLETGRKGKAYRLFSEVADLDATNADTLLGIPARGVVGKEVT